MQNAIALLAMFGLGCLLVFAANQGRQFEPTCLRVNTETRTAYLADDEYRYSQVEGTLDWLTPTPQHVRKRTADVLAGHSFGCDGKVDA